MGPMISLFAVIVNKFGCQLSECESRQLQVYPSTISHTEGWEGVTPDDVVFIK